MCANKPALAPLCLVTKLKRRAHAMASQQPANSEQASTSSSRLASSTKTCKHQTGFRIFTIIFMFVCFNSISITTTRRTGPLLSRSRGGRGRAPLSCRPAPTLHRDNACSTTRHKSQTPSRASVCATSSPLPPAPQACSPLLCSPRCPPSSPRPTHILSSSAPLCPLGAPCALGSARARDAVRHAARIVYAAHL